MSFFGTSSSLHGRIFGHGVSISTFAMLIDSASLRDRCLRDRGSSLCIDIQTSARQQLPSIGLYHLAAVFTNVNHKNNSGDHFPSMDSVDASLLIHADRRLHARR